MYICIEKNKQAEIKNGDEVVKVHEVMTIYDADEVSYVALFENRLAARLFLANQQYAQNNLDRYREISLTDPLAKDILEGVASGPKGALVLVEPNGEMKGYSIVDSVQNIDHLSLFNVYGPRDEMEERQREYNALTDQEIDDIITERLFSGDKAKKLIKDTATYGDHIKREQKKMEKIRAYLTKKGVLNNLQLFALIDKDGEPYFTGEKMPLLFVNIVDAYITREIAKIAMGRTFEVYDLGKMKDDEIRGFKLRILMYCSMMGYVPVCQGLMGEYKRSTGSFDLVGMPGHPQLYAFKEDPSVIHTGFNAVELFAMLASEDEEQCDNYLAAFFNTRDKLSKAVLEKKAKSLLEDFKSLKPAAPDAILMPKLIL